MGRVTSQSRAINQHRSRPLPNTHTQKYTLTAPALLGLAAAIPARLGDLVVRPGLEEC